FDRSHAAWPDRGAGKHIRPFEPSPTSPHQISGLCSRTIAEPQSERSRPMRFVVGRLGRSTFLIVGAMFLSFVFASMAPGDYFDEMKMNPQISPQTIAALHD